VAQDSNCTVNQKNWLAECEGNWVADGSGVQGIYIDIDRCTSHTSADFTVDYVVAGTGYTKKFSERLVEDEYTIYNETASDIEIVLTITNLDVEQAYVDFEIGISVSSLGIPILKDFVGAPSFGNPKLHICDLPTSLWCHTEEKFTCIVSNYWLAIVGAFTGIVALIGAAIAVYCIRKRMIKHRLRESYNLLQNQDEDEQEYHDFNDHNFHK